VPEIRKKDNINIKKNPPVIKVDLASAEFYVHFGPFMPYNSGGFAVNSAKYSNVIRSDSTIIIAPPKH